MLPAVPDTNNRPPVLLQDCFAAPSLQKMSIGRHQTPTHRRSALAKVAEHACQLCKHITGSSVGNLLTSVNIGREEATVWSPLASCKTNRCHAENGSILPTKALQGKHATSPVSSSAPGSRELPSCASNAMTYTIQLTHIDQPAGTDASTR